jgi:hypothetical protein
MDDEFKHGIALPDLWEIESFFECEAELAEPDEPWLHNHAVVFTRRTSQSELSMMIAPMHSDASIRWEVDGIKHVDLQLSYVVQMEVIRDQLSISFWPPTGLKPLLLQIQPTVQIQWSMELA